MKIYGQIERAQIENLTADPTGADLVIARMWFRTDLNLFRFYDGTIVREAVDLQSAQTLLNKILTAPAISDPALSGVSTYDEVVGVPATPAAGKAKFYLKDDGLFYTLDPDGNEIPVGSGGGGAINFDDVGDMEIAKTSDFTAVGATLSMTKVVGEFARGSQALKCIFGAAAQTVEREVPVPFGYRNDGHAKVSLRLQNAVDCTVELLDGATVLAEVLLVNTGGIFKEVAAVGVLPTSATDLKWKITSSAADTIYIDDSIINTDTFIEKELTNITDWEDYTPIFQGFGTVVNVDFRWMQVGPNYIIQGTFDSGTPVASEAQISLPGGRSILSDLAIIQNAGSIVRDNSSTEHFHILITAGDAFMNIGSTAAGGLVPKNGNAIVGAGNTMAFTAIVPIEGLTASNTNVVTPSESVVAKLASAGNAGQAITASTTDIPFIEVTDTENAWDGDQFTVPFDGTVSLSGCIFWTAIPGARPHLYVGGVDKACIGDINGTDLKPFNYVGFHSKGEVLSIRVQGAGGTLSNDAENHYMNIVCSKSDTTFLSAVPHTKVCYLKEVQTIGTDGGGFTTGARRTRTLNTLEGDMGFCSLSANQMTIDPGVYDIEIEAPAYAVLSHQAYLRNITDVADAIVGKSCYVSAASANEASVKGRINISSAKTYEVQHECETTVATFGLGVAADFGPEVYTQVKITKVK